jgi:hypothetical protein
MPDEEDRARDASSAADASWAAVVVPDDISALSSDIEAYRREQRAARRQLRIQRWTDRRGALPLAIVAFAVVIAGLVATLLTVLAPHAVSSPPTPVPLARSTAAPGSVGALLPKELLEGPAGAVGTWSIRPALIALIPVHCGCADLVTEMAREAWSVNLSLSVVVPAASDAEAAQLPQAAKGYTVDVYYDPDRTLATTYRVDGVTAVLVGPDGRVADRQPVTLQTFHQLGGPLETMLSTLGQG